MVHEHDQCHHEHSCCCHGEVCGVCHQHHHHKHEDFSHELIELADEAWMDVLYEKIKEQVIAKSGKQLDQLANLVAESNHQRWRNKLGANRATSELREKISEF